MKMMPPDVISHENQLQHLSEPSIFILDVFRTADHAGQIFITHLINLNTLYRKGDHITWEIGPLGYFVTSAIGIPAAEKLLGTILQCTDQKTRIISSID